MIRQYLAVAIAVVVPGGAAMGALALARLIQPERRRPVPPPSR
jgi:hypothetical protein